MMFLLFLMQNWGDMPVINDETAFIGNSIYNSLTDDQLEYLIALVS